MSLKFDIVCLRAPCEPGDTMGVVQLIARAKMAADQLEELTAQRDELLAALKEVVYCSENFGKAYAGRDARDKAKALIRRINHA